MKKHSETLKYEINERTLAKEMEDEVPQEEEEETVTEEDEFPKQQLLETQATPINERNDDIMETHQFRPVSVRAHH